MTDKLNGTRLILLEGLPGTGKTTDSSFLHVQLRRSGIPVRWIHEVASPHPTSFFHEGCMTRAEYDMLLRTYPEDAGLLRDIAVVREHTVSIDLLEIEWFHKGRFSDAVLKELERHDIWTFPIERYCDAALDKWTAFVQRMQHEPENVYIVDSSLFQFQIFRFLLKNRGGRELEDFIGKLCDIIRPLNPAMVYLCRADEEDSIAFLERARGTAFMEYIRDRDAAQPYYQDKPSGAEGFRMFLREYDAILRRLYDAVSFRKLAIDVSGQDWAAYERQMLEFFSLSKLDAPCVPPPQGRFVAADGTALSIDGNELIEPTGRRSHLAAVSASEFCVEGLPTVLCFDGAERLTMAGVQIHERWTAAATTYLREKL